MAFRRQRPSQPSPEIDFGLILANLSEDMRVYDSMKAEELDLEAAIQAAIDAGDLDNLDFETAVEDYSPQVAYRALEKMLKEKELRNYRAQYDRQEWHRNRGWRARLPKELGEDYLRQEGLKVKVQSLDPEQPLLAAPKYTIRAPWEQIWTPYEEAEGVMRSISLAPKDGGLLEMDVGKRVVYLAEPLVDRKAGYKPVFTIENA